MLYRRRDSADYNNREVSKVDRADKFSGGFLKDGAKVLVIPKFSLLCSLSVSSGLFSNACINLRS